jgi:hypothetical protein
MGEASDGPLDFWGKAPIAPVTGKGNRVGIADPIARVSGWPPRPAWLHPVKSASVQSDLAFLLFRLLRHDLNSLINPRRKTPRLARAYYKHLVNEWKLNKSG